MIQDFLLNVSQNLISATLPKGPINGIMIDNPSGSWLLIEPSHVYIPPYVSGWQDPLQNVTSVSVTWVNSPSGSVSNPTLPAGQRVRVSLSSDPLSHSDGFTSGAGFQTSEVPLFAQARLIIAVTETGAGGFGIIVPSVAGQDIIVTAIELVAFGGALNNRAVRDMVIGNIGWGGVPPPNVISYVAISPEHPTDIPILDPQAVRAPAGQDITYNFFTVRGGGACDVLLAVTYYRVVV